MVIRVPIPAFFRQAPAIRASKKTGVSDEEWARLFGESLDAPNVDTLYANTPWDYRATTLTAWMTSRVPVAFYRGKREVKPETLPVKPQWRKLLYLTSGSLSQHGAAYIGIVRNALNDAIELEWLSANRTKPEWSEPKPTRFLKKEIKSWKRTYQEHSRGYAYEDIVHVWLPSFTHEHEHDVSASSVTKTDSNAMWNAAKYIGGYFKRGTIQPTIITAPDDTLKSEIDRLERWWTLLMQGIDNAWRTVGLRAGVDVKKLGDKPSDLAIDELTKDSKENISAGHGVPDSMISGKDVNYASGQAQRLNLIEHTVMPRCEFIAEAWNERLLGPWGYRMEFLFQRLEIYRRLQEKRGQALLGLVKEKVISKKELRTLIDLPADIPKELEDPEEEEPQMPPPQFMQQQAEAGDKEALIAQEVKQFKKKVENKGPNVRFDSKHIPREMRSIIDLYIKEHPEDPFGWMRQ